jgi:hypothetical protein
VRITWCHHDSVSAPVREQSRKRGDERAIGRSKPRSLLLTSENRELVSKEHQFHVLGELGPAAADEQPQKCGKGKVGDIERSSQAKSTDSQLRSCAVQRLLVFARVKQNEE